LTDITRHMKASIGELISGAAKAAGRNPRELLFLARFGKAHKKASGIRDEYEARGTHVPPFLIASVARDCNLRCAGCYAAVNQACTPNAGQLPAERWEAIFKEAAKIGVSFILLAGGEPLMRPDVLRLAAGHEDIVFPVFTNGTLIDGEWARFFCRHRNLVPVLSIEGDREATDARRGEGVFDKLLAAMDRLRKKRVFFGASVTVTAKNVAEVTGAPFVSFLEENGCGLAFYVEYVPVDGKSEDLAPTDADREYLEGRLEKLREKRRMLAIAFPGDEKLLGGCLAAGRGFFHINPNGDAEPCPFSPYSDTNLRDCTLLEALQSPFFRKLRSSEILNAQHDGGCVLFGQADAVERMLV
jgi:MoaA/NifB/PqqE/SkfB family radical SAM enzyme